ncbi:MAG TPA: cytochrome P450 [Xanthobacteraceae bacterium]|nr:cytochrome P450 [Xanthobacteraceae bacterium]
MPPDVPVSSIDPFADDFLAAPYPFHAQLRDAGPVVWLERYGLWACARYAEVQAALSDWETFSSASGVGIDDFRRTRPWRPPSLILEADPPLHTRTRTIMNRALSAKPMAALRASFKEAAENLAGMLVARGSVDAVKDIAEAYPLSVFPDAIGLGSNGLENLLPYGAMVFNAFGPRNAHFDAAMAEATKVIAYINSQCAREALSPDGIGATIWAAVDTGEIIAEEAPLLVRSLLSAGLDTTVVGIGNALYAFASNPAQWQALRENPALARPGFDEVLRWESPVQTFFRTTTKPVNIGDVAIPADAKILLFLASANRDPRKWNDPEHFDITRRTTGHVAFGAGIHLCVGQMLARLEAEMIITALASRAARIDIIGEPRRKLNNSLRQFASLPIELIPV